METLKICPFCGSDDIGIKESILEYKMGNDCPCSAIKKVWAYCRRCECEGRKTTIDAVYDEEVIAAATEAWNKRYYHDGIVIAHDRSSIYPDIHSIHYYGGDPHEDTQPAFTND